MSSEPTTTRKKRAAAESTPAPEGDHRKRRRNRTTQSCLNCHTSKRMCDRKRPACARCTQLGLTGLCVYEVDDPSQRPDQQDESARLLKRVAELEGVIRELKNKPHPRWVQTSATIDDFTRWPPRAPNGSDCSSSAPSPPSSTSPSERGDSSTLPPFFTAKLGSDGYCTTQANSPLDTPSPGLLTPTDEYPLSHIGICGSQGSLSLSGDYDLTSMFLSYPGLMGCGEDHFGALNDGRLGKQPHHCGCLHEAPSYNAMLELSLRLRRAAEVLKRTPTHHLGKNCQLQQRISELDTLATNALSDISVSPSDLSDPLVSTDAGRHNALQNTFHAPQLFTAGSPALAPLVQHANPWEIMPSNANSPTPPDDSFMTWEPRRT